MGRSVDVEANLKATSLPVNVLQGTAGQEVTAYEAMSSLVNYIQPNKFVSFDNAKSWLSLQSEGHFLFDIRFRFCFVPTERLISLNPESNSLH